MRGGIAFVALAMVLVACSGGTGATTTVSGGGGGSTTTAAVSGTTTTVDAASRTLTGSFESVPPGMDPADRANLHHFAFSPVLGQLVLFAPGDGARFAPVSEMLPDLAESWTRDEEGNWTFVLRDMVSSAGNPLTAEDVRWSIERTIELNRISQTVWNAVGGDMEEPVTVIDERTVRLNTRTGNESLLGAAALFEFGIIDSVEALKHATADDPWAVEWMRTNLPSFGPYVLEAFVPDTEIVYTKNPNYWDADSLYFDRVVNRAVTDATTLVALMQAGELDFGMPIPFSLLSTLEGVAGIMLDTSPTMLMTQINLDLRTPPFSDPKVRHALSMAIDRAEINQGAYSGYGTPSIGVATRALAGNSDPQPPFVYDPEGAKALLAEAGYPDGFTFTLSYSAQGTYAGEQSAVAVLIQQQLAKIGVNVNINAVASPAEYSAASAEHLYEATIGTQGPLLPDLHYLIGLRWAVDQSLISPGFRNENLIALNAEAVTVAGTERERVLREMLRIANEDLPVIPLIDVPNQWALREDLTGWFVNGGQTLYPHLMTR